MTKPFEAFALVVLSASPAPSFMSRNDWYELQGVLMGTALAAMVGSGTLGQRLLRMGVSVVFGVLMGETVANLMAKIAPAYFEYGAKDTIIAFSGLVALCSWGIVRAIDGNSFSISKKILKGASERVIGSSGGSMGEPDTGRAVDFFARPDPPEGSNQQDSKEAQESKDGKVD